MYLNNWFDFPIHVFIDTQVYINESYNFNEKGNLSYFRKQIIDGKVVHLTSEIVVREVEKHIKKDVSEVINNYNKVVDDRKFAIFREKGCVQLQKIKELEMVEEAVSIFHTYLSDTKAFKLSSSTIDLESVISDYFEVKTPFGIKKDKKSEFPDAFNISMLRKYAMHNRLVIIVSGDGDFSNEEDIVCFKTLSELLDAINSQEEITQKVKEYLKSKRQYIFDEVESFLMDNGYALEVDGTDTDRKGYQNGVEYEEVELLSFTPKSLANIEVVNIDLSEKKITITLDCKAKLEFSCSFIDEAFRIFSSFGTMQEIHNSIIPLTVEISFENDNGNVEFDIDNLEVNISEIELNQYTLMEGSRVRTDDPNRYWDANESVNNPCPDCGCEMTFETEGGNGFCVNCAPNH